MLLNPNNWWRGLVRPLRWLWIYRGHAPQPPPWLWRIFIYLWRIMLLIALLDAAYVWTIWPDFDSLRRGPIPKSHFIQAYELEARFDDDMPRLKWQRIPAQSIPAFVKRAAIVGEDARFYSHNGIDTEAIADALDKNLSLHKWKYGGSTISQQTVKNLYFSSDRSLLRKWHELLFTLGMEHSLSKERILEIYLNIAEFGEGIFGIEAAAQHYYNTSAANLSERQAAELIATLPAPKKDNPTIHNKAFVRKANAIYRWIQPGAGTGD